MDQRTVTLLRAQGGLGGVPLQRTEAEHILIEGERALEVAYLQPDWPEPNLFRQTKSAGRLSVRSRCCRLGRISLAEDVLYGGSHRFLRWPGSFAMSASIRAEARLKTQRPLLSASRTGAVKCLRLWRPVPPDATWR